MVSTSASSIQKCQEHIITIFYGIVPLAICDSNYFFTLFDLGQYGSINDCGVLAFSTMAEIMENDKLGVPAPFKLRSCSFDSLPHFFFFFLREMRSLLIHDSGQTCLSVNNI